MHFKQFSILNFVNFNIFLFLSILLSFLNLHLVLIMTTYYCQFNCGNSYKNDGKAKINHEYKCSLNPANTANLLPTHFDYLDSLNSINHKRGRSSNKESAISIMKKAKIDKDVRIPCMTCNKTFIDHKRLNNHVNKFHSLNTTIIRNSNGLSFVLSDSVSNKPDIAEFLSKFNMTVCVNESEDVEVNTFLDNAFASANSKHPSSPSMKFFESDVSNYLLKYNNNLSVGVLNINTIINKFHDITFILSKQLLDIFIINESKLNKDIDDSLFTMNNYDIIRRDRLTDGGGGVVALALKVSCKTKTFCSSSSLIIPAFSNN